MKNLGYIALLYFSDENIVQTSKILMIEYF